MTIHKYMVLFIAILIGVIGIKPNDVKLSVDKYNSNSDLSDYVNDFQHPLLSLNHEYYIESTVETLSGATSYISPGCKVTGCNGEICANVDIPNLASTCLALPEYQCYVGASCEVQPGGDCGWTQTSSLLQCISGGIVENAIYVDFNYSGTSVGTEDQPYDIMDDAIAHVKGLTSQGAGETIYIKDGDYDINLTNYDDFGVYSFDSLSTCDLNDNDTLLTITADPSATKIEFNSSVNLGSNHLFEIEDSNCLVFDGAGIINFSGSNGLELNETKSLIKLTDVKDMVFRDSVIHDSPEGARGISYYHSGSAPHNIHIEDNTLYNISTRAIGGYGNTIYIDSNLVYDSALINEDAAMCAGGCGGWPGILQSTTDYATDTFSANTYFRDNVVHDCWGEGIIANRLYGGEISGNTIYNTFGTSVYLDNARNVDIFNNYIYSTSDAYDRPDIGYSAAAFKLSSENEVGGENVQAENLRIYNNLTVGAGRAISYFHDPGNNNTNNTYKDIYIYHNTFVNNHADGTPILINDTAGSNPPINANFKNNIIFKSNLSGTCGDGSLFKNFYCISPNDIGAWNIANNHVIEYGSSYTVPGFIGPSMASGDPVTYFKLSNTSPNINVGSSTPITVDFYGNLRDAQPDRGFYEYIP